MAQTLNITTTSLQTPAHTFRSAVVVTAESRVEVSEVVLPGANSSQNAQTVEFRVRRAGLQALLLGADTKMTIQLLDSNGASLGSTKTFGGGTSDTLPVSTYLGDFVWPSYSGDPAVGPSGFYNHNAGNDIAAFKVWREDGTNTANLRVRATAYFDPTA